MTNIPDELIYKAARGDMKAFEEIFKLASGFVYAVSYRVTRNRADAQEAAQDVFLKVHRNLGKFEEGTSFKAWIYRITVNTAINYYNRRKRHMMRQGDFELAELTEGTDPEVDARMEKEEKEKKISELLGKLNPDQRACIVLRAIEGLSYEEIAKALNVKINTVRTRLKRAREILMKYTEQEEARNEMQ